MSVTLALYMGRKSHLSMTLVWMFLIGLVEDIAYVRPLGVTSAILVTLTAATWLFESLYRTKLLWWWFGFGLVGEILMLTIAQKPFSWQAILGQLVALLFVFWVNQRSSESEGIYVGQ